MSLSWVQEKLLPTVLSEGFVIRPPIIAFQDIATDGKYQQVLTLTNAQKSRVALRVRPEPSSAQNLEDFGASPRQAL